MTSQIQKTVAKTVSKVRDFIDEHAVEKMRQPLPGANESGEALDIPGYFQIASYTCGYIAGLNVLHTFHPGYPAEVFRRKLNMEEDGYAEIKPLIQALKSSGIGMSVRRKMSFKDIVKAISEGFPVILLIRTNKTKVTHWVVAYGYQRDPESVLLAGKGVGLLKQNIIPREKFEQIWYTEEGLAGLICWGKPLPKVVGPASK